MSLNLTNVIEAVKARACSGGDNLDKELANDLARLTKDFLGQYVVVDGNPKWEGYVDQVRKLFEEEHAFDEFEKLVEEMAVSLSDASDNIVNAVVDAIGEEPDEAMDEIVKLFDYFADGDEDDGTDETFQLFDSLKNHGWFVLCSEKGLGIVFMHLHSSEKLDVLLMPVEEDVSWKKVFSSFVEGHSDALREAGAKVIVPHAIKFKRKDKKTYIEVKVKVKEKESHAVTIQL